MRTLVLINGNKISEAGKVKEIAGKFYHAKSISISKTREIIEEEARKTNMREYLMKGVLIELLKLTL